MGIKKIEEILKLISNLKTLSLSPQAPQTLQKQILQIVNEVEEQLNQLNFTANTENTFSSMKYKGDVFELPLPIDFLNEKADVAIFADGASRGNPGSGAYAVFAQSRDGKIAFDLSDFASNVTNNQMELQAVICGLKELLKNNSNSNSKTIKEKIFVYTDSRYVVDGANSWLAGWKKRNWKKADNKAPENLELWQTLDQLIGQFESIKFIWVKGHNNHPQNERCDKICNKILDQILSSK